MKIAKIVDLKTGAHKVSPDSPQLEVYALALLQEHADIDAVDVYIYQDGLHGPVRYSRAHLEAFGVKVSIAAFQALDPTTKPVPGATQCKWCPARDRCTARAIDILSQAGERFGLADLGAVLPVTQKIAALASDLEARAQKALEDGASVPGYKLVEGQSRRRWRADAIKWVREWDLDEALLEESLVTLSTAEKRLGKSTAAEVLSALTERPAGKPVLAPATDPRPSIESTVNLESSK